MTVSDSNHNVGPTTADLMASTGPDDAIPTRLVHGFSERGRADPLLGPDFTDRITEYSPHFDKAVVSRSPVAQMTVGYHVSHMPKQLPLPAHAEHFHRWLTLFRNAAQQVCTTEGAAWVIERVKCIPASIHMSIPTRGVFMTLQARRQNSGKANRHDHRCPNQRSADLTTWIEQPLAIRRTDHDDPQAEIAQIRTLPHDQTLPEDACRSRTVFCHCVSVFLEDLGAHSKLDNDVLFPRFKPA